MRDEHRRITSGPYEIATRVVGEGPLVILMHGWPELGISWRHQIEPLAQAGFSVAVPDMRGFGESSKPATVPEYRFDVAADDMAAIADTLGHSRWTSVGHDAGSMVAWRTALRFPDRVVGVFSLSVPYLGRPAGPLNAFYDARYADEFFYMRYFQQIGVAEAELERDARDALKRIFFSLSGDAPLFDWTKRRPCDAQLLEGLTPPPAGPLTFMDEPILDAFAEAFERGGFFGPLSWYRNPEQDYVDMLAYDDAIIRQPSAFLCGEKEILLNMFPGVLEHQRASLGNMRLETVLPGAGHWIQQERPTEVTAAILRFLAEIRPLY